MTDLNLDAIAARAEAHPDALWIPAEPMDGGPYHDDTNGSYVKAWVRNSPVGSGFLISVSLSQSVDVPALLARCRDLEAENERLRAMAEDNWRSWEREATEHARTLGLIGAPKTGEPLSEGEQRRFEAAVERGLRKRAEDQRDDARAAIDRVRALHQSRLDGPTNRCCRECCPPFGGPHVPYPCATIRALDGGATDPQTQEG